MSKEYLEAWNFIKDQMSNFTFSHLVTEMAKNTDIVNNALNRLDSIDNANPSEALEDLAFIKEKFAYLEYNSETYNVPKKELFNIEQALLRAQEPKQHLKWEDLEFDDEYKEMIVRMGDNVYKMKYKNSFFGDGGRISLEDCQRIYLDLFENEKQFFNDLHLERVEE